MDSTPPPGPLTGARPTAGPVAERPPGSAAEPVAPAAEPVAPLGEPAPPVAEPPSAVGEPAAAGAEAAEDAAERERGWRRRRFDPASVTVGELSVLGAAAAVAVVALVSLAAAHLGQHRLSVVLPAAALLLVGLGALAVLGGGRPRVVLDLPGLLPLGAAAVLAAWTMLPGFHYAAGDRDPGGYVLHAFSIARTGSYQLTDPLLTTPGLPVQFQSPGTRLVGIWVHDAATGQIVPQFYHLWPGLLATSYEARGFGGLVNTGPLIGVLAVLVAVALTRRIGGVVAGWTVGLLLATNMMQVWQAKYPTAEIFAQLLYLGALLGIVLAIQTRWRWPALLAGLLVGAGYLNRADGLVLVLLAVGGLAGLWVLRRFDARAGLFAAGLGALLPYGLWQAYGPAARYTKAAGIPALPVVLGLVAAMVVGAVVLRPPLAPLTRWLDARLADRGTQRRLGLVLLAGAVGLFVLGLVRPLFGFDYAASGAASGPPVVRTFDERNLYRLSWFFTWPGLALLLVGVAVLLLRRWSAASWLVLGLTVGLLALYAWHTRNSPFFMWVGRRFVPTVVPGMVILIGVALGWLWTVRRPRVPRLAGPVVALGLAGFLGVAQLQQSVPLRHHDEWGGSYQLTQSIAGLSGDRQGVYLWQWPRYCCAAPVSLLASSLWFVTDEQSVLLPRAPADVPAYVQAYARHFGDRPLFLVYETRPPPIAGLTVTPVARFTGTLPRWQESSVTRPTAAIRIPYNITVYRIHPTT